MIKPTSYRILLKQLPQEMQTESGIVIHTGDEMKRQQTGYNICEVIDMGPACFKHRESAEYFPEGAWCEIGDKVFIQNYGGKMVDPEELMPYATAEERKELNKMKESHLHFHIVNDEDIMGVLK